MAQSWIRCGLPPADSDHCITRLEKHGESVPAAQLKRILKENQERVQRYNIFQQFSSKLSLLARVRGCAACQEGVALRLPRCSVPHPGEGAAGARPSSTPCTWPQPARGQTAATLKTAHRFPGGMS